MLASAAALAAADPEKLVWAPGKKVISIPGPAKTAMIIRWGMGGQKDVSEVVKYHDLNALFIEVAKDPGVIGVYYNSKPRENNVWNFSMFDRA